MHTTPDTYITLAQAAQESPRRPSTNCVWRWCREGILARSGARVQLQHVRIGRTIFTTRQWLADFAHAVANADREYFQLSRRNARTILRKATSRTPQERAAAIARAERRLQEAGV